MDHPMLIDYVYRLGFSLFRSDRRKLAEHSMLFQTARSVLDLGGYPPFWQDWKISAKVVCLNVDESAQSDSEKITCIIGDGCNTGLEDHFSDICFSNSVIEHVGKRGRQQLFADATILRERFLLMTKSIVAYKSDNA